MVIEYYPAREKETFLVNDRISCPLGWPNLEEWPNMILRTFSKNQGCSAYTSSLSIKTVINGKVSF